MLVCPRRVVVVAPAVCPRPASLGLPPSPGRPCRVIGPLCQLELNDMIDLSEDPGLQDFEQVYSVPLANVHRQLEEQVSRTLTFDVLHREKVTIRFLGSVLRDYSVVFHDGSSIPLRSRAACRRQHPIPRVVPPLILPSRVHVHHVRSLLKGNNLTMREVFNNLVHHQPLKSKSKNKI
uniref:Uncharacterized protein n=1 Tax=Oryza brachyantha TaxID=4533 RepID=J3N6X4_ORYBR